MGSRLDWSQRVGPACRAGSAVGTAIKKSPSRPAGGTYQNPVCPETRLLQRKRLLNDARRPGARGFGSALARKNPVLKKKPGWGTDTHRVGGQTLTRPGAYASLR